jgi:hypothetical protein
MLRGIQTYEDKRVGQTDSAALRTLIPPPDYEYGTIEPEFFRKTILARGAVMLRNAADKQVLERTQKSLTDLFKMSTHSSIGSWAWRSFLRVRPRFDKIEVRT